MATKSFNPFSFLVFFIALAWAMAASRAFADPADVSDLEVKEQSTEAADDESGPFTFPFSDLSIHMGASYGDIKESFPKTVRIKSRKPYEITLSMSLGRDDFLFFMFEGGSLTLVEMRSNHLRGAGKAISDFESWMISHYGPGTVTGLNAMRLTTEWNLDDAYVLRVTEGEKTIGTYVNFWIVPK